MQDVGDVHRFVRGALKFGDLPRWGTRQKAELHRVGDNDAKSYWKSRNTVLPVHFDDSNDTST